MTWRLRSWIRTAGSVLLAVLACGPTGALRAEDCHFAGNLVPNCGFDTDLSDWALYSESATHVSACGPHTPGCVELTPLDVIDAIEVFSACIPVTPSTHYRAAGSFRQSSGIIDGSCNLTAVEYSNDCGAYSADESLNFAASTSWQDVSVSFVTATNTNSAQIRAYCGSSQQFSVRLDDFIFAEGAPTCVPDADTACLLNGRFRVEVRWTDFSHLEHDAFVASAGTPDSALFYWHDPNNWEVLIKAIDACTFNDKFWIYLAAATNVGYEIMVTDTVAGGAPKVYSNPLGTLAPAINDSAAFDCP